MSLISGCSSTASTPSRYVDKVYGYSVKLPSGWTPPARGSTGITSDGVQGYVVHFIQPPGFRIVVRSLIPGLTQIPNGRVLKHDVKHGCATECIFHVIRVSGRLGILIEVTTPAGGLAAAYVDTNSPKYGYELQLISATHIVESRFRQFETVVTSFRTTK
jgi:hypothetical protein